MLREIVIRVRAMLALLPCLLICLLIADASGVDAADKRVKDRVLIPCLKNDYLARDGLKATVFQDKIWIIGGDGGNGVVSFKDLSDWKVETEDEALNVIGHAVMSFKNSILVVGGSDESGFIDRIMSSPDGRNWQGSKDKPPFAVRADHSAVVFQDKIWIMGGSGEELNSYSDVWDSTDGRKWELVTSKAGFGQRELHASVVFNDKIWVLGGSLYNEVEDSREVWCSGDGRHWTLVTDSAGFEAIDGIYRAAVYDGRIWIAVWGGKRRLLMVQFRR